MIISRRFISALLAVGMSAIASAQEGKLKIATVDMQQLFKDYYKTAQAQKQIDVEKAKIAKEYNERQTKIRDLETEITNLRKQLDDGTISDTKKQSVFAELQSKNNEGIALDQERREFAQRRQQALNEKMLQRMKGILEEIRKLVEEQAKSDNYDYVFDKSGMSTSQVPFLLYTKDATDITAVILKSLNKDAPADSAPAKEEAAPAAGDSKKD
jgi:outer membrane protein